MARREITQIYDDLDDKPLQETDVHVIRFSIDGSSYVMDVSKEIKSIRRKTCGNGPRPEDMRSRCVGNFPGN